MGTVRLDHVYKRFGDVVAVNDLSLEVRDEEFLVFVGPSGCGKTTALRMIAGLEEQTSGDIYIGDRLVNDVPPKDRDIAMVFQNYALYPHMDVTQNLAFGLKLRHVAKSEIGRRIAEGARMLGLERLLKRKPRELSGGQRQRVALGRAIVREPKVFLMDEPLSNLDAKLRVQTRAEILELHQRVRTTTVYVTHDQVEAMTMGDRIAVMRDGILQQLDTPENVYLRPANLFVAGFIGSPPMNFLRGKIAERDGQVTVDAGAFALPVPSRLRSAARDAIGRDVVYGIRPEDIEAQDGASGWPLPATVDVVEYLGNELQIHARVNGSKFVARVPTKVPAQVGGKMPLRMQVENAHIFDIETEEALRG
ncbi:MAG TPA: sn-glycerol-3-phosphate ABC transporter ATP-binding protein UgpC [Gaiellaceae bacterium]|nr:sn-glycerol-3-phosphate ABC transporter ATP-binding protein UgpC [Gaiellaceae bacterium]